MAPFIMLIIIASTYLLSIFFNHDFLKNSMQILEATEKTIFGVGHWGINLAIIFGMNILIAPVINIFMFLGEEIGWRGFMVPRLLKLYGPKRGFLIGGSIWALWHAGGILLGFNYPGHPLLGNLMMILMCIPLGIILQYLYFKSKSIFVPALAHGAINWTASTIGMFVLSNENYNTMLYGPTGVIGIVVLSVIAILLFRKMDWEKENSFTSGKTKFPELVNEFSA
jgi:membrane protease YdiL (CAAX protease family)